MTYRQVTYWPGLDEAIPLLRWFLVTVLFMLFLLGYICRARARHRASGPMEILLPGLCAVLPFTTILLPPYLCELSERIFGPAKSPTDLWLFIRQFNTTPFIGLSVMAIGEAITVWGMLHLGRNFSIATDVRNWVHSGPYRWIRHPLYSGEIISLWGYAILWPSWWSLLGSLCFSVLQCIRAKGEEKRLLQFFPDYEYYRHKTGMLLPTFVKEKSHL
jgi:protein-S-isoprenylcysteine O-methyltransferase Ste14